MAASSREKIAHSFLPVAPDLTGMKKILPRSQWMWAFMGLGLFTSLGVRGTATADDPVRTERIPGYAIKLSAELIGTNLTTASISGPFMGGRKSQISKEELGLKILAEIAQADIQPELMLNLFWELIDDARTRPAWSAEIRRVLPLTSMPSEYQARVLEALSDGETSSPAFTLPATVHKNDEGPNLRDTFEEAKKVASHIPKIFPIGKALVGALDVLEKHLIGPLSPGDCYEYDPNCQFGSNRGLIGTYSERVVEDHELALSVLRFALRIRKEDYRNPHPGNFQTTDKARVNIWPMALEAANGDVDRALETITVFGHDVCCNRLYAKNRDDRYLVAVLNVAAPNIGGDYNPISNLFAPGALGGAQVPGTVLKRLHASIERFNKVFGTQITLRAGYYHLYGGMASARALLSQGYASDSGLRLATLFPEALGHFYKRLQLPRYLGEDAKTIWDAAEGDESKIRASVPKDWDQTRIECALAELEMHLSILEYTQAQHRAGALFAFKAYKKAY